MGNNGEKKENNYLLSTEKEEPQQLENISSAEIIEELNDDEQIKKEQIEEIKTLYAKEDIIKAFKSMEQRKVIQANSNVQENKEPKIQATEKTFECEECKYFSAYKENLKRHVKAMHTVK